jgi:hypothetical protein
MSHKWIIFFNGSILILLASLWAAIGGTALGIGLAVTGAVSLLFAVFALGGWWSARLMRAGAEIALQAQASDDNRDLAQVRAIAGVVETTLKLAKVNNAPPPLETNFTLERPDRPALPSFTIDGLDPEDEVHQVQ